MIFFLNPQQLPTGLNNAKRLCSFFILVGILILAIAAGAYYFGKLPIKPANNEPKACTQEAKQCPDGSYVSREGPNCEFSPCPSATQKASDETANWKTYANSRYKYEVKYPSDWDVVDVHTTEKVTFGGKGNADQRPPLISIHVFETAKFRTQDILNYTPFDYKIIEKKGYTFFIVASTYQIGATPNKETEEEAKIMLAKILPTFKFLDSEAACPTDAKQCPDGSWVVRTSPNCKFAPCP